MYCKNCKKQVRPADKWYLFDNTLFTQRVALIGKCPGCKQEVVLLAELRKTDFKKFVQLEVGQRAKELGERLIGQIDYTLNDSKPIRKPIPYGWKFGKGIRLLKEKCWKILRCDWFGNSEVIGYIPFDKEKILNKEEYGKRADRQPDNIAIGNR